MFRMLEFVCGCGHGFEALLDLPPDSGVSGHQHECEECGSMATSVISATAGHMPSAERTQAQLRKRSIDHGKAVAEGKEPEPGGRQGVLAKRNIPGRRYVEK